MTTSHYSYPAPGIETLLFVMGFGIRPRRLYFGSLSTWPGSFRLAPLAQDPAQLCGPPPWTPWGLVGCPRVPMGPPWVPMGNHLARNGAHWVPHAAPVGPIWLAMGTHWGSPGSPLRAQGDHFAPCNMWRARGEQALHHAQKSSPLPSICAEWSAPLLILKF